jgi:hypothetical protein
MSILIGVLVMVDGATSSEAYGSRGVLGYMVYINGYGATSSEANVSRHFNLMCLVSVW